LLLDSNFDPEGKPMKKKIPTFKTDEEAEDFVANADLTEYDLSGMVPMRFELRNKKSSSLASKRPKKKS
jgi:predicted DNA binding CopG/RHH family protein